MTKKLNIPNELRSPFHQLMQMLPYTLQNDIDTQNIILVYLKLGGEKMARHGIEIIKMRFLEEIQQENEELYDADTVDVGMEASEDPNSDHESYLKSDDMDDDDSDDYESDF
jgi:hypothetical protein